MDTKFRVKMKKDEEVLKDFISFTYRAQGQMSRMKARIFAIGLMVIGGLAAKGGSITAGIVIGTIGCLLLIFILFLPMIAVARLKKADRAYNNGTELEYVFGSGGMYVYEDGELAQKVGGYGQVTCFYGDEKNYYLGLNNDDLYLLPKKCFAEGEAEEFVEFIQRKSSEMFEFLPLTLKNKWLKYKIDSKQKEMEYDAKAAAKRAEAKEKREKRKSNKKWD